MCSGQTVSERSELERQPCREETKILRLIKHWCYSLIEIFRSAMPRNLPAFLYHDIECPRTFRPFTASLNARFHPHPILQFHRRLSTRHPVKMKLLTYIINYTFFLYKDECSWMCKLTIIAGYHSLQPIVSDPKWPLWKMSAKLSDEIKKWNQSII